MFKIENSFSTTIDILNIDYIIPIEDRFPLNGSIKDFGKLNEGFCVKISTIVPYKSFRITNKKLIPDDGKYVNWVFCLDSEKNKNFLIENLIKLKLINQHSKGIIVDFSSRSYEGTSIEKLKELNENLLRKLKIKIRIQNENNLSLNKSFLGISSNNFSKSTDESIDGYWVVMKDWSECTLKCDGGKQFQQLLCIPPKKNGKPCIGDSIIVRPCNIQPCPREISQDLFLNSNSSEIITLSELLNTKAKTQNDKEDQKNNNVKIEINFLPISNRPLEYDKCNFKESDALLLMDEFNNDYYSNAAKLPVRLIMNKNAVSAYTDEVNIFLFVKNLIKYFRN